MNIGTIGSGMIVREFLTGISRLEGIFCSAVYSRHKETGCALAEPFGIERVYTSLEDLLTDPDIDTLYIASPNSLHGEQARMALEHGKHVILEKPFAPTKREAEELFALAEQQGRLILEAITILSLPNYKAVRELLPQVGRVRIVQCCYSQYSSRYDALLRGELPNVFNPAFAGGALQDINLYNIYFAIGLFGKPEQAVYYPNRHKNGIDTSGVLVMRYPDFICSCEGAKDTRGVNMVQIQGEAGYIYVKNGSNSCSEITLEAGADSKLPFTRQDDALHWCYEAEELTAILQSQNKAAYEYRKRLTLDVIEVMEQARINAGIRFPSDNI